MAFMGVYDPARNTNGSYDARERYYTTYNYYACPAETNEREWKRERERGKKGDLNYIDFPLAFPLIIDSATTKPHH